MKAEDRLLISELTGTSFHHLLHICRHLGISTGHAIQIIGKADQKISAYDIRLIVFKIIIADIPCDGFILI